ncbi:MAG TPA: pyridoxamine 5'-phosphate oxidase, partial [Thalassospira sp.]|nr:pyridoxamine 5'-phosphate oxidase [Thalassospira sp.]
ASRPRGSQLGAWASIQSRPMSGRFDLEKRVAEFTAKFGLGKVPRPDHWGGFRLVPDRIEFWSEGKFRLHDRKLYTRDANDAGWDIDKLFP